MGDKRTVYYTEHYLQNVKSFIQRLITIREHQYRDGFCEGDQVTEWEIFSSNSAHYRDFADRMILMIENMVTAEVLSGAVKRGYMGEERILRITFEGHLLRVVIFVHDDGWVEMQEFYA